MSAPPLTRTHAHARTGAAQSDRRQAGGGLALVWAALVGASVAAGLWAAWLVGLVR
jgi:hypothetical protein